jgi:hypothetical protein
MDNQKPQIPQKQPGGYGKRPIWQWVVLYIIVGAIVYGLIYYFFMRGSGGSSYTY